MNRFTIYGFVIGMIAAFAIAFQFMTPKIEIARNEFVAKKAVQVHKKKKKITKPDGTIIETETIDTHSVSENTQKNETEKKILYNPRYGAFFMVDPFDDRLDFMVGGSANIVWRFDLIAAYRDGIYLGGNFRF